MWKEFFASRAQCERRPDTPAAFASLTWSSLAVNRREGRGGAAVLGSSRERILAEQTRFGESAT